MYERILTRAEIKENAKKSLREHRSKAILNWFLFGAILWAASLLISLIGGNPLGALLDEVIYAASSGLSEADAALRIAQGVGGAIAASFVSSAMLFLVNLVAAPILAYGVSFNSLRLYRNDRREAMDYKDLFIGFQKQFGRNLGAYLWKALFLFLWGLIPIAGSIIVFVKRYAYSMTPYIIVEHPEIDARQALKESIKLTSGHKLDLFVLDLSFIGWDILSFFTFGLLPIFFLTPYKGLTFAGYYTEYEKNTIGPGVGLKREKSGGHAFESHCVRCGKRIGHGTLCADCAAADERRKCPRCGAALVDGRCPNCADSILIPPETVCKRCGRRIDRGSLCAECTAAVERLKCPRCGALLFNGRCPNCSAEGSDRSRVIIKGLNPDENLPPDKHPVTPEPHEKCFTPPELD